MDKSKRGKVFVTDSKSNKDSNDGNVNNKFVSKRKIESYRVEESKIVQRMKHVDYQRVASIQFCVDGAVGLPQSVTATRVTARLIDYNRCQIGEPSASSISNPDSSVSSPIYDLHAGWRANQLIPSITVVCRVDTLERPSLKPRCVGFAALKLFLDENGLQPAPEHKSHGVYLNAGQYLLPIVHGTVPSEGLLTETLMDSLPHIYDAYLSVRLFDPHVENEKSAHGNLTRGIDDALATDRDYSKFIMQNSVASAIVHALPYAHESVVAPAISDMILTEIRKGVELDPGEKKVVLRQCNEWLARQFPPVVQKVKPIDHRFMLKYEHRFGAYVALDMLYSMPQIPNFMAVTRQTISQLPGQGIFRKPWDNRVAFYKTYFRYLPGSHIPKKLKSDATDFVIDDASIDLDFTSKEFNPVFLDEFSRTTGFELSVNACLLVVVSMVDIMTGLKYDNINVSPYVKQKLGDADSAMARAVARPMTRADASVMLDAAHVEERNAIRAVQEQAFKLRGLVSLTMGHDDPQATWWGILPLMLESPYERVSPAGASKNSDGTSLLPSQQQFFEQERGFTPQKPPSQPVKSMAHTQSKYGKQSMVTDAHGNAEYQGKLSPRSREHAQSKHKMSNVVGENNGWIVPESKESPPNTGYTAGSSGRDDRRNFSTSPVTAFGESEKVSAASRGGGNYFINTGTHQVPLFQGLPPKDMMHSSNPMAWLISNIGHQKKDKALNSGCIKGSNNAVVDPSSKQSKKKPTRIGPKDLQLSDGASAMISLVDPRLRQFCHDSIVRDPEADLNQDSLIRLLKVKASSYDKHKGCMKPPDDNLYKKLFAKFQYNSRKFAALRPYETAVPANVLHSALLQEINQKFAAKMSES